MRFSTCEISLLRRFCFVLFLFLISAYKTLRNGTHRMTRRIFTPIAFGENTKLIILLVQKDT